MNKAHEPLQKRIRKYVEKASLNDGKRTWLVCLNKIQVSLDNDYYPPEQRARIFEMIIAEQTGFGNLFKLS